MLRLRMGGAVRLLPHVPSSRGEEKLYLVFKFISNVNSDVT